MTGLLALRIRLVSRMKGVVEIDAGQDRKYVGLQERDQQLKRGQCNGVAVHSFRTTRTEAK